MSDVPNAQCGTASHVAAARRRACGAAVPGALFYAAAGAAGAATLPPDADAARILALILALVLALFALRMRRAAGAVPVATADERPDSGLTLHAVLSSLLFAGVLPALAWPGAGLGDSQAAVPPIAAAALFAPLLLHRGLPLAGYAHLALVVAAIALVAALWPGVLGPEAAAGGTVLALVVAAALRCQAQADKAASTATAAADQRVARLAAVVEDFEAHGADATWTTEAGGRLQKVGPRLVEELGLPVERLEHTPLADLVAAGPQHDLLARHLAEGTAFRDLDVPLRRAGDQHWLRLSARPCRGGGLRGTARDVTAARQTEARVAFMAHYDSLTGLANRYLFNERLRTLTAARDGEGGDVALFYLDLDDFKAVNDTRGHQVGDRLLREIGSRIAQEVRREDMVARLGGDEFAVLIVTRAGDGLLIERAHRLLSVVRAPIVIDGQTYRQTTSIGIARVIGGDCDAEEVMRRADLALYEAKRKGRDSQALFDPALDRVARERRALEADLREALPGEQFRLHYQPIIDLDSGATTGFEALLRWQHPRRGLLAPGAFLDAAEETGQIVAIGEWVVREALRELCGWPGEFRIALNLSPTQVRQPSLVAALTQALQATGIAAERIELEITEHILLQGDAASLAGLEKLRAAGMKVALDDFGTGYSSLGYLRRFPFDRIKIDRCFVAEVVEDAGCQAIVSTITRLADAMGMRTTAEGVERRDQLDLLRKLGVHEAQGFLIARPAGLADLEAALREGRHGPADPALSSAVIDYRRARTAVLGRRTASLA